MNNFSAVEDSLKFDYWNSLKFDVIVGNPPYQDGSGGRGKGHALWVKFTQKAINELLVEDGYLVYVHPALWRQLDDQLGSLMKKKNLLYLNINDENEGLKNFKVSTRYDWYVLQNRDYSGSTIIDDEDGMQTTLNIAEWRFVPNSNFSNIKKLLAGDKDKKVNVLHARTDYGSDKSWVRQSKDSKHNIPCVYSVNKNNMITPNKGLRWSSKEYKNHFVPKCIFQLGFDTGTVVDETGKYGVTNWCAAIVDNPKDLEKIKSVMTNKKFFTSVIKPIALRREINVKVLRLFKKDFWKEFV